MPNVFIFIAHIYRFDVSVEKKIMNIPTNKLETGLRNRQKIVEQGKQK